SSGNIITLNRDYIRGAELYLQQLFKVHDVSDRVRALQPSVISGLENAREVLKLKRIPYADIGIHCHTPYPCDFIGHCWKHIPYDASIFSLTDMEEENKWLLYAKGIVALHELPYDLEFSAVQRAQLEAHLAGDIRWDRSACKDWFKGLNYPLAVGYVSSVRPAVPLLPGMRPYANFPYGFSLTVYDFPGAEPVELTFLTGRSLDEFLQHFKEATDKAATILLFEGEDAKWALRDAAKRSYIYSKEIYKITAKIKDISQLFSSRLFYHPRMNRSVSPDVILPVFGFDAYPLLCPVTGEPQAGAVFESIWDETDSAKTAYWCEQLGHFNAYRGRKLNEVFRLLVEGSG
nr:DUF2779 domain-containing protein [Bacteroidota bacterium]